MSEAAMQDSQPRDPLTIVRAVRAQLWELRRQVLEAQHARGDDVWEPEALWAARKIVDAVRHALEPNGHTERTTPPDGVPAAPRLSVRADATGTHVLYGERRIARKSWGQLAWIVPLCTAVGGVIGWVLRHFGVGG